MLFIISPFIISFQFNEVHVRNEDQFSSRTDALSTERTGDDIFEDLSFFLHKTNGALMLLIRYEDFEDDFGDDDEENGRGVLRVLNNKAIGTDDGITTPLTSCFHFTQCTFLNLPLNFLP